MRDDGGGSESADAKVDSEDEDGVGKRPFFLYFSFVKVHTALFNAPGFDGATRHGAYGDNFAETDWAVGRVRAPLYALLLPFPPRALSLCSPLAYRRSHLPLCLPLRSHAHLRCRLCLCLCLCRRRLHRHWWHWQVMSELKAMGELENTIVWFSSDNGPCKPRSLLSSPLLSSPLLSSPLLTSAADRDRDDWGGSTGWSKALLSTAEEEKGEGGGERIPFRGGKGYTHEGGHYPRFSLYRLSSPFLFLPSHVE